MYCPKCGNILPDNSLFCDKCGCSLKQGNEQTPQNTHTPDRVSYTGATAASTKAKTWIERLDLSAFQKANAILSLCATLMLLICIDGSIYLWLYLLAAVGVLVLTVKKIDQRHILSAAVPSISLLSFVITNLVTIAAGQRLQAVNIVMQVIFAAAVVIMWLLCVHPNLKEKNKSTAILMTISLICLSVIAVFLLISFFINLRYVGWNFRVPFGNLGNSAVIVSYILYLSDEGKTLRWIKEALQTPAVQQGTAYQSRPVTPAYVPYHTPTESDTDDAVVCTSCGNHLPKGSMFCDNCGSSLQGVGSDIENDSMAVNDQPEEENDTLDTTDTVICPTCGSEVDGDSAFCEYCGTALSFPKDIPLTNETDRENDEDSLAANDNTDERSQDIHTEEVVCPKCGNVMPEDSVYCDRCGEHIAVINTNNESSVKTNEAASEAQRRTSAQIPQEQHLETDRSYKAVPQTHDIYSHSEFPVIHEQAQPKTDERLGFLNLNEILIDEKLSPFKFANAFRVYDLNGNNIGTVQQVDISGGAKAARVLLGKGTKGLQQFHYQILDINGKQLAAVHRDGGAFSQIRIVDSDDKQVGYLSRGKVYSPENDLLCNFKSDWKGWNLTLTDPTNNLIGEVKKKWNGVGKELFTSADKYYVSVNPSVTGNTRIAILGMAIIYDILLHER